MILLRNPEIALLLSGRNLSLLWPRVEAWKPASPTVTQRKDSLCRKISWKQSDYNTRNDHVYPWFMMEVDLTRESLPWWDDRWQQSEQHWCCPLRVWNGRASNTGDVLLVSGTAGRIFACHFESCLTVQSPQENPLAVLHSNYIAKKLFVFMTNLGNGELLRPFWVAHWEGKVVFTEPIGRKLSQLSKRAAHQHVQTGPPWCSGFSFSFYYAICPTKEHFKFLNHQI